MMMYIWMCVMMQAFAPGGSSIASNYVSAMQNQLQSAR